MPVKGETKGTRRKRESNSNRSERVAGVFGHRRAFPIVPFKIRRHKTGSS